MSADYTLEASCDVDDDHDVLAINYRNDGVLGPIDVLSDEKAAQVQCDFEEWIQSIRQQSDHRDSANETNNLQTYCSGNLRFKPHLYLSFANRLVRHPKLVDAVQRALGSRDIYCWSSDFNIKDPHTEGCFPPHQDATYAGLYPADQVLTAWVAISDHVGINEGGLVFWKGSHKVGQIPHGFWHPKETPNKNPHPHNLLARGQYCDVTKVTNGNLVSFELRRGQATLHHFYCVHASGPNGSTKPRIGLAIRYMTARVRRKTGPFRESITWIFGNNTSIIDDVNDGFDLEPILPEQPTDSDMEKGRLAHSKAVQLEAANYFETSNSVKEYG